MSSGSNSIGPRGLTLLGLAAAVGIALGIHGWATRHTPAVLGSVGGSAAAASAAPAHNATAGPPPSQPSSSSSPASTAGQMLSSQPYAQYAFQVWPGNLSPTAQAAEVGLAITVRRTGTGLEVSAGVIGQPANAPRVYPAGVRVYVIEASLGDDSGNTDYNLGDDGLVVTDAGGRIVQ